MKKKKSHIQAIYFTHHEANKTPKITQNPEK